MNLRYLVLICFVLGFSGSGLSFAQQGKKTPVMGWSSWNEFRTNIDEKLIREQADAMLTSGMKDAGYTFINIDDGYFGGRDKNGNLLSHPVKFPGGMKALAGYIHAKGLKAGIYSDAGKNTCGSRYDKDPYGKGVGLYGHEKQDLKRMLDTWGYDFIKVDWCGGKWLKLDERSAYTKISKLIREIRPDVVYNVCRWKFPGEWVTEIADSWRISGDITNKFKSVLKIIDLNTDLGKYASPGHVNDMDMLQVGRGMTYEEDKAHFSMWCMLNSPLLAGNDLRNMSDETLSILTNKEVIALNQDELVFQARLIKDKNNTQVWAKPLYFVDSGELAVAFLNRSEKEQKISIRPDELGIDPSQGYRYKDLWTKTESPESTKSEIVYLVKSHAIVVIKIKGTFSAIGFLKEYLKIK